MSLELQRPLEIPESVVVGTGSYTIPANKYAKISVSNATASYQSFNGVASGTIDAPIFTPLHVNANTNNNSIIANAGTTISTALTPPPFYAALTGLGGFFGSIAIYAYTRVNIDGQAASISYSGYTNLAGGGASNSMQFALAYGWQASIFPISKINYAAGVI
jgi:hypothetical protein